MVLQVYISMPNNIQHEVSVCISWNTQSIYMIAPVLHMMKKKILKVLCMSCKGICRMIVCVGIERYGCRPKNYKARGMIWYGRRGNWVTCVGAIGITCTKYTEYVFCLKIELKPFHRLGHMRIIFIVGAHIVCVKRQVNSFSCVI